MRKFSLLNLFTLAFVAYILGVPGVVAQNLTGDWTANTRVSVGPKHRSHDGAEAEAKVEDPNKIHLSFNRTSPNGGKNQHGSSFSYSDLEGLTRQQAESGGPVRFRLVREAGIIDCEGTFANGKGSGTFTFTANKNFVDAMRTRGFDFEKQSAEKKGHNDPLEKLFAATTLNVTTALADDLRSANFPNLDVEDLFKAAIFKIDGKFMSEMKGTGFPNLGMEDLVKARIFKIDANYVRQVKDMGFTEQGFEGLVKFRIFKVTPEFLNELKAAGLDKMDAEDIVKARIFKIDGEFIRQARAEEPNITMEELVQMKIGVRRRTRE